MPTALTYPGVYIEELPSAVRTITGVATSITAFAGRAWRGPVDTPVTIFSYADYQRIFGGLWRESTMSYAVQQFYQNGGSQAIIVRVAPRGPGATAAKTGRVTLAGGGEIFVAESPGSWAANVTVTIDRDVVNPADTKLFNLIAFDDPALFGDAAKRGGSGLKEVFRNVSVDPASPRFITTVLEQQSHLIRVDSGLKATAPSAAAAKPLTIAANADGGPITSVELTDNLPPKTGIYALDDADLFNLLCIPPYAPGADVSMADWTKAAAYCKARRAFLIVDPPKAWTPADAVKPTGVQTFSAVERAYAALYYPYLLLPDPLQDNNLASFAPCGVVAGLMARTDGSRGVWKAPAGIEANLQGVLGIEIAGASAKLIDNEIGILNPKAINCLRNMPNVGHVCWGARTLEGADALASQWKYVPVRRLALFLEESLYRGTQWVVFEPNDEPLWGQIRLNLGAFMQTLFRKGAFQGLTPKDAYFVKCDRETTSQTDIDNGVVNIVVGFAPLKSAEFVVIQIQQIQQIQQQI